MRRSSPFLLAAALAFFLPPGTVSAGLTGVVSFETGGDIPIASVAPTDDGGFLVAGSCRTVPEAKSDLWIARLDAHRRTVWSRRYGGESLDEAGVKVRPLPDGDFVVVASILASRQGAWILRIDPNGDVVWQRKWGSDIGTDSPRGLAVDASGRIGVVVGKLGSTPFLLELTPGGELLGTKRLGGSIELEPGAIEANPAGGWILCGTGRSDVEARWLWLAAVTTDGSIRWSRAVRGRDEAEGGAILVQNQRILAAGAFRGAYWDEGGVAVFDLEGNLVEAVTSRWFLFGPLSFLAPLPGGSVLTGAGEDVASFDSGWAGRLLSLPGPAGALDERGCPDAVTLVDGRVGVVSSVESFGASVRGSLAVLPTIEGEGGCVSAWTCPQDQYSRCLLPPPEVDVADIEASASPWEGFFGDSNEPSFPIEFTATSACELVLGDPRSIPGSPVVGEEVRFEVGKSGFFPTGPLEWEIGNGIVHEDSPFVRFDSAGVVDVRVSYRNSHDSAERRFQVVVREPAAPPKVNAVDVPSCTSAGTEEYVSASYSEAARVEWDFGDGTTVVDSATRHHTWLAPGRYRVVFRATNGTGTTEVARLVDVGPARGNATFDGKVILPVVTRSPGLLGTFFRTELTLENVAPVPQAVAIHFVPGGSGGEAGRMARSIVLAPFEQVVIPDLLLDTFGIEQATGSLTIEPSKGKVLGGARIFNTDLRGSFGQRAEARPPGEALGEGETGHLPALEASEARRTNVGLTEVAGETVHVELVLFDAEGSELGRRTIALAPFEQMQLNGLFEALGAPEATGRAEIGVRDGAGKVLGWSSVVEATTGDAAYQPALRASEPGPWVVPAAASAPGLHGADWQSELLLANVSDGAIDARIDFFPKEGDGAAASRELSVGAGASVILDDVVRWLVGGSAVGALRIEGQAGLLVSSRTFTHDPAGGELYGQHVPELPSSKALRPGGRPFELPGLRSTVDFRTNLGLTNASDEAAAVELRIRNGSGEVVHEEQIDIPSGSLVQLVGPSWLPAGVDCDPCSVEVALSSTGGELHPWASIVDNRTNDPVLVPASPADIRGALLEGMVYETFDRFPVEGATVTVNGRSVTTDASGRYRFEGLPFGRKVRIEWSVPGEVEWKRTIEPFFARPRNIIDLPYYTDSPYEQWHIWWGIVRDVETGEPVRASVAGKATTADGNWLIDVWCCGSIWYDVIAPGYLTGSLEGRAFSSEFRELWLYRADSACP
jgi:PKD repeat protein